MKAKTEAAERLDYVGVAPCGCVRVLVSERTPPDDLLRDTADIVRRGYDLRRLTPSQWRKIPWGCDKCRA